MIPAEAITAAARALHDDECCDGTTETCGRWLSGSDRKSRHHELHVGHVRYYHDHARPLVEAAAPAIVAQAAARHDEHCCMEPDSGPDDDCPGIEAIRREREWFAGHDAGRAEGVAAERDRIRQVAIEHHATYPGPVGHHPFADLLGGES
jgi:hypothetical protein